MRSDASDLNPMPWQDFLPWFEKAWKPGQHVALIGPTGVGKSTFAVSILKHRRYVLAFDPKGGDETLSKGTGYERINRFPFPPSSAIKKLLEEGKPVRRIVGQITHREEDVPHLIASLNEALGTVFAMGGWTVYIDELQIAADKRMGNMAGKIEMQLVGARSKGISMVTSFQAPRWVPRAASDQATWMAVWYTRDRDVVNRLAEMTGRPANEIRGAMRELDHYCIMLFSRNPRDPIVVTYVPKVV